MEDFTDYYAVLHIQPSASDDEIKRAFHALAKKYHPDINTDSQAQALFIQITQAYAVLTDPEKRKDFDIQRENIVKANLIKAANEEYEREARERFALLQEEFLPMAAQEQPKITIRPLNAEEERAKITELAYLRRQRIIAFFQHSAAFIGVAIIAVLATLGTISIAYPVVPPPPVVTNLHFGQVGKEIDLEFTIQLNGQQGAINTEFHLADQTVDTKTIDSKDILQSGSVIVPTLAYAGYHLVNGGSIGNVNGNARAYIYWCPNYNCTNAKRQSLKLIVFLVTPT
jgi:hypothetical protein